MAERSYAIRDWNPVERSFRILASTPNPVRCFEWDPKTEKLVEFWEALVGWNLARFEKNNLILESHGAGMIDSAVGLGTEAKETEDGGLEMKVTLAPASAGKRVTELEEKIKAQLLRGVSVGFDYGERTDEERDGKTVRVYRNNTLSEVSLCLIPKDEDALLTEQTDEKRKQAKVSNAGKLLAYSRKTRTDANDDPEAVTRTDFIGSISKFERTQVGGLRVPARLTRTGVLHYKRPDGTIRRELRLASEVFNADSLQSLHGATITDLEHHRGLLNTFNWKDATLGHTEEIRKDGNYVEADLVVNDARAIADIENGRLHDISCGYSCRLDAEPGVFEGEPYDVIQRRIRYNHVAVLPKGKGRAGPDVALRLDAKDAECVEALDQEESTMADPTKRVIRIDGKDLDYGSPEHIKHLEDAHLADLQKAETDNKALVARCDAAEGKAKDAETRAKKAEDDAKEATEGDGAKAKRKKSDQLRRRALRALSKVIAEDDEDEDEEKMDALDDELAAMSDKDVMLKVIRADAAYADDKEIGDKPEPYIQAIFDGLTKRGVTRTDGIDSATKALDRVKRVNPGGKDPADESRARMNKNAQEAWTKPLS